MAHSSNIIHASKAAIGRVLSKYIGETEKNFFLMDDNTRKHCFPVLKQHFPNIDDDRLIVLDHGDKEKNISSLHSIWSFLQLHGANRNSTLINLGGGMITDLGGFAAATYMRGIKFIHIPTSLLGMADAAIGGKTAINIAKVKNQAGTFSAAEAVIIYPPFLESLPQDEFLSAYAEILKTAIVADRKMFLKLKKDITDAESVRNIDPQIIKQTAEIKNKLTFIDFHDHAERQCLNFGHTIGHGLESFYFSQGSEIKHGFAVAAGILCEAWISTKINKFSQEEFLKIEKIISGLFPRVSFSEKDIDAIATLLRHDKKNNGNDIRMTLISSIGQCSFGISCKEEMIRESLRFYLKITK